MEKKNKIKVLRERKVRTLWNEDNEKWYFSIIDVIEVLTDSPRPRKYWNALKTKLKSEGSELSHKLGQLKMQSADGKFYLTDVADTEQLFRLIQSIPSSKAEPFKQWLAQVAAERLDDLEAKRERDAEFTGEKYISRFTCKFNIPGSKESIDKNELRWSVFKHKPADEMLLHVQMKVFPFLKTFGENSPSPSGRDGEGLFTKHMANAVFIMPKSSLLVSAINIVEDIFKEIEKDATEGGHAFQDIQGDVYEMLLSEIATR